MDSITSNLPAIALILAGLGLVTMLVMQALQISQLRQRLDMLTRGVDGESLEGVLDAHLELVHQVSEDLDELAGRTVVLETMAAHHYSRAGMVRFNPFPDTGGNQSFALAMLDESDDGFIISSLHSRTGTRIYAKSIAAGKADNTLSTEEAEAIDLARARKPISRPAPAPARPAARPAPAPVARQAAVPVAAEPEPVSTPAPRQMAAPVLPPATTLMDVPAPEPEAEYLEPEEPIAAPQPRKAGLRGRMGFLAALKPGGAVAPESDEESEALPEIAEPPVRVAALSGAAAVPAPGSDRKAGVGGQTKGAAESGSEDSDHDPDRTGRSPGSIGR